MPKNSASVGIPAVVALVSGPRKVNHAAVSCRVTTISQLLTATEMNESSGTLCVRHVVVMSREVEGRFSKENNSTARFMTGSTDHRSRTHRSDGEHTATNT